MRLKPLVIMMALLPVMAVPTSTAVLASDLSLYRGNTTGKTSILLMLDTSGSMGISSLVLPKNNKYGSPGDVGNSICIQRDVYENSGNSPGNFLEYQYNAVDRRLLQGSCNWRYKSSLLRTWLWYGNSRR